MKRSAVWLAAQGSALRLAAQGFSVCLAPQGFSVMHVRASAEGRWLPGAGARRA
jgi:hypothetical protein